MTKINKLGKSTFVIAILAFLLVAVLAFGGTYAYFSDAADKVSGSITMGHLEISDVTGGHLTGAAIKFDTTVAQPNQVILNDTFKAKVTGDIKYYTRVKLTVLVETKEGHKHAADVKTDDDALETNDAKSCNDYFENAFDAFSYTINDGDKTAWDIGDDNIPELGTDNQPIATTKVSSKYYYKLTPQTATAEGVTEDFKIKIQAKDLLGNWNGTAEGCDYWMDATITISLTFEVLQADYLNAGEDTEGVAGDETQAKSFESGLEAEDAWTTALATGNKEVNP